MVEFKFNIGDFVMVRAGLSAATLAARCGEFSVPTAWMVIVRQYDECSGGVQLRYGCSCGGHLAKFSEIELMPESDFDLSAHLETLKAARKAGFGVGRMRMPED